MTGQTGEEDKGRLPGRKHFGKNWKFSLALAFLFLAAGFFLGQVAGADTGVLPGSEGDPLVTAGWVEARLTAFAQALKTGQSEWENLDDRMQSPEGSGVEQPVPGEAVIITSPASVYEVVVLQSGTQLLTGSGTEFILRSGKAKAIAASGGGIADLTSGKDLENGEAISADHLLLSPKDDGRGALTETDAIFMVRGKFSTVQ